MATILTVAFAFGSAVYAFTNKYLLIAVVISFYIILQALLARRHRQKLTNQMVIYHAGHKYQLKGYLDSGNTLIDPVTKLPVNVISLTVFLQMFPQITAEQIILHELDQNINNGHYVNCQTVNGMGKIFVFQADKIKINGIKVNKCLLGVTSHLRQDQYDALINVNMGGLL